MKNTQKKLKAKHFRYLSKENIENPMSYLEDFYGFATDLAPWLDSLNTLINASFCAKMKSVHAQPNGNNCKRLITQVEFAYLIFHRCNLKKIKGELNFQPVDYRQINFQNTENKEVAKNWINDTLSLFFSFTNLKGWYEILDRLWLNLIDMGDKIQYHEKIGEDQLLIIKELFTRLAIALHLIYESGELPNQVESLPSTIDTQENLELTENNNQINDNQDLNIEKLKSEKEFMQTREEILSKIRFTFTYVGLDYLQQHCNNLNFGIKTNYKNWNDLFEITETEDILLGYRSFRELVDVINSSLSTICSTSSEIVSEVRDIKYSPLQQKSVKNTQFLSPSEISNPEYYLYILHQIQDEIDWSYKLDELFYTFLTLDKSQLIFNEGMPSVFLFHLEKLLELAYLIAFKDEIEFIDMHPLEQTTM